MGFLISSIFLRALWQAKFGKTQQQYIFTGVGGDQLSGLLASGLNTIDDTFALLHWNPTLPSLSYVEFNEVIAGYCTLDRSFQVVVQYLLASVIFHAEWIKSNYPSETQYLILDFGSTIITLSIDTVSSAVTSLMKLVI